MNNRRRGRWVPTKEPAAKGGIAEARFRPTPERAGPAEKIRGTVTDCYREELSWLFGGRRVFSGCLFFDQP